MANQTKYAKINGRGGSNFGAGGSLYWSTGFWLYKDNGVVGTKMNKKSEKKNHFVLGETTDPRARWYVVHTYSGHDVKVAEQLKQRVETMGLKEKIFEMLVPTQEKIQVRAGTKLTVKEKIFPGYLLIKMILTDESWLIVRTTSGITGFIGTGDKPSPLEEKEVAAIQKFVSMAAPKFKTEFSTGEAVKVTDGPFNDFLGSIESINEEKGTLKVLISIFGRETPVELDVLQVQKI